MRYKEESGSVSEGFRMQEEGAGVVQDARDTAGSTICVFIFFSLLFMCIFFKKKDPELLNGRPTMVYLIFIIAIIVINFYFIYLRFRKRSPSMAQRPLDER